MATTNVKKLKVVNGSNEFVLDTTALEDSLNTLNTYTHSLLTLGNVQVVSNVDANNYITSGTYYFATGCSNVPGTYFLCTVVASTSGDFVIQTGVQAGNKTKYKYRVYTVNSWTNWIEVGKYSDIVSKEFMPSAGDSLLSWLVANINNHVLPKSFVKIGSNTMSDTPSIFGGSEFCGFCYGNGARYYVHIVQYGSGREFRRSIFIDNWLGSWEEVISTSKARPTTGADTKYFRADGEWAAPFGDIQWLSFSGTTSAGGNLKVSDTLGQRPILYAYVTSPGSTIAMPYSNGGDVLYLHFASDNNTTSVKANTAVSGKIAYFP